MMEYEEGYKILSLQEILSVLKRYDADFYPRLSNVTELSIYAAKLYDFAYCIYASDPTNKTPAGFCFFYDNNLEAKEAFLTLIGVDKEHQGKGIARSLMQRMVDRLKNSGFISVSLEVNRKNSKAMNLYRSFDFSIFKQEEDSIFMKLYLT